MPGRVAVHARGRHGVRIVWIVGEQDALQARQHLLEDFQALRAQVEVPIGDAGDVAAGPGEALDEPQFDRIAHDGGEDDRDPVGGQLRRPRRVRVGGENDVNAGLDQVAGRRRKRGDVPLREPDADDELLALSIAQRLQPVTEADHLGVGPQDCVSAPILTGPVRSAASALRSWSWVPTSTASRIKPHGQRER